jgi:ketosteroid isomerase-like protein
VILQRVESDYLQIARSAIAAYNVGDYRALLELINEDVVATIPVGLANAGVYRGHEGFRRMMDDWRDAWVDFRVEAEEPFLAGDAIVVPVRHAGRGRGSGIEISMDVFHVAHFRDNRVASWRLCGSREEALAHATGK